MANIINQGLFKLLDSAMPGKHLSGGQQYLIIAHVFNNVSYLNIAMTYAENAR